jgi:hypothetical protein
MPKNSKLKLFRVLVSTHRTDYLLTNEVAQDDTQAAEQKSNVRWLIEQFHREAKQLTGLNDGYVKVTVLLLRDAYRSSS